MAKETKKQKVAVIDFEKFSVAQLPELQGKKDEIKSIIEANPVVKIVDNSTYELAKKSRTAVRTLRTSLESEQKTVKKKIKEHVLDVVDREYDTLVLGVKSAEQIRQEPITAWEEKKGQERLEKERLEELRVKQIKEAIQTFKDAWIDNVNHLLFEGIAGFNEMFESYSAKFDRSQLAEFEVLFDDAISVIRQLADSKIKTLTEQEQIRITQIELAKEKERQRLEAERIAEEQRIEREKFEAEQKVIAEKQRIAQEKFQKEKAEFEAKQLEAKYQERKKFLVDEDYWRIYLLAECGEEEDVAKAKLSNFSDSDFEDFKLAVLKAKEPKEEVKTDEIAQEQAERIYESEPIASNIQKIEGSRIAQADYHESDVDPKGIEKEVTWESIFEDWKSHKLDCNQRQLIWQTLEVYLMANYNVPTKKQ